MFIFFFFFLNRESVMTQSDTARSLAQVGMVCVERQQPSLSHSYNPRAHKCATSAVVLHSGPSVRIFQTSQNPEFSFQAGWHSRLYNPVCPADGGAEGNRRIHNFPQMYQHLCECNNLDRNSISVFRFRNPRRNPLLQRTSIINKR